MSALSDQLAAVVAAQDRQETALTGIAGDVKGLKDLITQLQNSPGTLTPADQATVDAIQAKAQSLADRLEALDAETPPVTPTP